MFGKKALQLGGRSVHQNFERVDLRRQVSGIRCGRKLLRDVVADLQRGAARDPAFGLVERGETALAGARRFGNVDKARLSAHRQQFSGRQKSRVAVEVVAGVVVAEHQGMPQEEVEQGLWALVVGEARLLAQRVERGRGRIDQPLNVVAIVGV